MKILLALLGLIYVGFSDDYGARGIRQELVRAGRYVAREAIESVI